MIVAVVLFRRRSAVAGWLAVTGLVLMVGVLAVTLAVEVPIDNDLNWWTVDTLRADWMAIGSRWAAFRTFRTLLSLGSVSALVGAALIHDEPARSVLAESRNAAA